jgi:DNA-binding SARP family transcriptional activator
MMYDGKTSGVGEAVSPDDQQHQLKIQLFGELELSLNGAPIGGNVTSKAKSLLAYLAVEADRPHRREFLAEMFWPGRPQGTARNSLRQAIVALRQSLEDSESALPYLLPTTNEIQFNLDSQFFLDAREFEQLVRDSFHHEHKTLLACADCEDRLRRVVGLYHDDFLIDAPLPDTPEFDNWVVARRETYRREFSEALRVLISMYENRNEYREGTRLAQKLVALEPWDEANHRILMRSLALAGRRSAAMKQYQACKRVLAAEFDAEPSSETTELYSAIRDERLAHVLEEPLLEIASDAGGEPHSKQGSERAGGLDRVRSRHVGIALAVLSVGALLLFVGSRARGSDPSDLGDDAIVVGTHSGIHIAVSVEEDWFWFNGFPSDATIDVSIYESSAKRNELWNETVIAEKAESPENERHIHIGSWLHGVDLMLGNMIVVSDGRIEDAVILERITVDVFDAKADIMAGTAPSDRLVWVVPKFGPDGPDQDQHRVAVYSDPMTGEWMVDFASRGVDLQEGWRQWSFAWVADEDGDASEGFARSAGSP